MDSSLGLRLVTITLAFIHIGHAQDQKGFISLDCGLPANELSPYSETYTRLSFSSDENFIQSGKIGRIQANRESKFGKPYRTLRYFPNGTRNDLQGQVNGTRAEMLHIPISNSLQICLVKTGTTTPFISTLEIQPMGNDSYITDSGSLKLFFRRYFSASKNFISSPVFRGESGGSCKGGECSFQLTRTNRSTLPPLVNALEVFTVIHFPQPETNETDVFAVQNIKTTYGISRISWQGDPCVPQQFIWDGLSCSNTDMATPPRITHLNLSSSGLTGNITDGIQNLTLLETLVVGEGGFGIVYHGTLNDYEQVAVKLLSQSSTRGYRQFKAEVDLLMRVHHTNLVNLVGYCNEGDHLALIYEFVPNGDLRQHLSGKGGRSIINWGIRLRIAVEAASGLF
ncbi:hypothetical protein YC2023_118816 [Brassica napus]